MSYLVFFYVLAAESLEQGLILIATHS